MKELVQVTQGTQAEMRKRWDKEDRRSRRRVRSLPQAGVSSSPEWPLVHYPFRADYNLPGFLHSSGDRSSCPAEDTSIPVDRSAL